MSEFFAMLKVPGYNRCYVCEHRLQVCKETVTEAAGGLQYGLPSRGSRRALYDITRGRVLAVEMHGMNLWVN